MANPTTLQWDGTFIVHTAVALNEQPYVVGDVVGGERGRELYAAGKAWVNVKGLSYAPKSSTY